ncbi:MAG: glucoamylase family protein [Clostridia bacterium]
MPKNRTYYGISHVAAKTELTAYARELALLCVRRAQRTERMGFPQLSYDRRVLIGCYKRIRSSAEATPAAEIIREDFYVIEKNLVIAHNEWESRRHQLPVCAEGIHVGLPRAYSIAANMVMREGPMNEARLTAFLDAYQSASPLTIGELWALPDMIRIALLKLLTIECEGCMATLRQYQRADAAAQWLTRNDAKASAYIDSLQPHENAALADRLVHMMEDADEYPLLQLFSERMAFAGVDVDDAVRNSRRQAENSANRVRDAIAGLRYLDSLNIKASFERFCRVEHILREDGCYPNMDERTKTYYRQHVERIARKTGAGETVVASAAMKLTDDKSGKCAHVGWYLFDAGQQELLKTLRPDKGYMKLSDKTKLIAVIAVQLILTFGLVSLAIDGGLTNVLLTLLPAWSIAGSLSMRLFSGMRVRMVPRMAVDKRTPIPRTLVVLPVLISGEGSVTAAFEQLETHYLAGRLDCYFAVLGDFADADTPAKEGEKALLNMGAALTEKLNEKYGRRFFYLHRKRTLNDADGLYMGHERKRGALMDMCALICEENTAPFLLISSPLPQGISHCLTLDADTKLPIGVLGELIGAAMHPLNRPETDAMGTVVRGYGIIAPRVRPIAHKGMTRFARIMNADAGVLPYLGSGEFFQDTLGSGIYSGKGMFDVQVYYGVLRERIADNTVLSHDLIEGCLLNAGYMGDVVLYDTEPGSLLSWWKREHRWIRGDYQQIPFLFKSAGADMRMVDKYKIILNLLRPIALPAALLALLLTPYTGWGAHTAAALLMLLWGLVCEGVAALRERIVSKGMGQVGMASLGFAAMRALLWIAVLPYSAYRATDAVVRTLYRMTVSHRHMLEWQTAAQSGGLPHGLIGYYNSLVVCPVIAALMACSAFWGGTPVLSIVLALIWGIAPLISKLLDRAKPQSKISDELKAGLIDAARATWGYFETFANAECNFLPPDNLQLDPPKPTVKNTSPTNIGMGMMACVCALDFGFIGEVELIDRIERMLCTIERMEKWHGHLYNWYGLRELNILTPKYVSTVDSGNLAASLMTVASAMDELVSRGALDCAQRCRALTQQMDFCALYDADMSLFYIGYDCEAGELSRSHYDLLASEARLTSLVAIALGQLDSTNWFALGRLLSTAERCTLMSWSGTMFEYLMPVIFTGIVEGTLLYTSALGAVEAQRNCAKDRPWGISESGYFEFDRSMYYQYRAFGVPQLSLATNRERERVTAPYASALALMVDAAAAAENLARLDFAMGEYGFFEAVDYTPDRLRPGADYELVESFMAHHQGMALCAMNNALNDNALQKRFLCIPQMRAAQTLLAENCPRGVAIREFESVIEGERQRHEAPKPRVAAGDTVIPETVLLTNGTYTVFIADNGTGFSKCGDIMLNRWRPDMLRGDSGVHMLIREGDKVYSAAPDMTELPKCALFSGYMASFLRENGELESRLDVCVSARHNGEVRRLAFKNRARQPKELEIGVFAEVCLASQREDLAHPAFVKLTVDASLHGEVLLFRRRSVSKGEQFMYCALKGAGRVDCCTDRLTMPGRGRGLHAAMRQMLLPNQSVGMPVEPGIHMRTQLTVEPGEAKRVYFIMGYAESKDKALAVAAELMGQADTAFEQAAMQQRSREQSAKVTRTDTFERMAARLLYGEKNRTDMVKAEGGIAALWRFSISGDNPIAYMRISRLTRLRMVKSLLELHEYMLARGVVFDLVLFGDYPHEYANELRTRLAELIAVRCRDKTHVHVINGFEAKDADSLMRGLCTIEIDESRSLDKQFAPVIIPKAEQMEYPNLGESRGSFAKSVGGLRRYNGFGGFNDMDEYVISLRDDVTPLPWCNILANDQFGTLVTESGGGYTWKGNSRLNKLTMWHNDPVRDPKGEMVLLTDTDNGVSWTVTPGAPRDAECTVTHGYGYTVYSSTSEELLCELTVFVDVQAAVKYSLLRMRNPMTRTRNINVLYCVDWVLGEFQHTEALYTQYDGTLITQSLREPSDEYAYIAMPGVQHEYSADRLTVLNGGWTDAKLNGRTGQGGFSALRTGITLHAGEERTLLLLLGQESKETLTQMLSMTCGDAKRALEDVKRLWQSRLGGIRVKTPDEDANIMLNGRLLYQVWSSRLLGRTGFYQCGGAFGFRDQLQDVLSLKQGDPDYVRAHILRCAARQFQAGDVLHWWHEPNRGVRTRISDDRLFLPYAVEQYIEVTGDDDVLDEIVSFLDDAPIPQGRRDLYDVMSEGEASATLYEHCALAIDASLRLGSDGLPLMDGGDWNDGMDMLPQGSRSVWLGWFLLYVLDRFLPIANVRSDERAAHWAEATNTLRQGLEQAGWDGAWYKRAITPQGALGSQRNAVCSIDCISQAWAALCGGEHAQEAMDAVMDMLLDEENRIIRLLAPPFAEPDGEIGYISAYLPGVRENGGQYTHATAWAALAMCALGRAKDADKIFSMLLPLSHGMQPQRYKAEPYAVAADIYSVGKNAGRGGWTWYTGAAGWIYTLGIEHILGIRRYGDTLHIAPCTEWESFEVEYRYGGSVYCISVTRSPDAANEYVIPLVDDGSKHEVQAVLHK